MLLDHSSRLSRISRRLLLRRHLLHRYTRGPCIVGIQTYRGRYASLLFRGPCANKHLSRLGAGYSVSAGDHCWHFQFGATFTKARLQRKFSYGQRMLQEHISNWGKGVEIFRWWHQHWILNIPYWTLCDIFTISFMGEGRRCYWTEFLFRIFNFFMATLSFPPPKQT